MPSKYEPLTQALAKAAGDGQQSVDFEFEAIADMVGGLPPSADTRQWWANNSQTQAWAWRSAGFHVEQVSLDGRRVRFALGERGGTYSRQTTRLRPQQPSVSAGDRKPVGEPVDVRVTVQWLDAGSVRLDAEGKPIFELLEATPGLYRMTLTGADAAARPRVYIGETDNLRRRLAGNYRNPGPSQQTSLRINAQLRKHLATGGVVDLAIATSASVYLSDKEEKSFNLTRKAGRLLAENAALVLAQATDHADIINLG